MERASYKARAPGNLMVMGEHAVLHGHLALVCAVNQYMHVTLTPQADRKTLHIESALGSVEQSINSIEPVKPFTFVLEAVRQQLGTASSGFTLTIASDFSDRVGLGSSAAVTAATHAVLAQWQDIPFDHEQLFDRTLKTIHAVQGRGSGADAAASIFGGLVAYRATPKTITRLPNLPTFSVIYSGSKTPTVEVIRQITEKQRQDPDRFQQHYSTLGLLSEKGRQAAEKGNWELFGQLMNEQQLVFDQMELSTPAIAAILAAMKKQPAIRGAKISGAGLGDCVIGLGKFAPPESFPYAGLPMRISNEGTSIVPG